MLAVASTATGKFRTAGAFVGSSVRHSHRYHQTSLPSALHLRNSCRATTTSALRKSAIGRRSGPSHVNGRFQRELVRCLSTSHTPRGSLVVPSPSILPSFDASAYVLPAQPCVRPDLPVGSRVVAIGDVHGDVKALMEFLSLAGVIDPKVSTPERPVWCGGDTVLVQCGDVLDRGAKELACWRILTSLARQAQGTGTGSVVMLFGNHEALNAVGQFQYADAAGNDEFEAAFGPTVDAHWSQGQGQGQGAEEGLAGRKGSASAARWRLQYAGNQPTRWAACEPGGLLAGPLLSRLKVAAVVGRTLFVHAGLTARHILDYGGIEAMNREASEWITTPLVSLPTLSTTKGGDDHDHTNDHTNDNNNDGDGDKPTFLIPNHTGAGYRTVSDVIAAANARAQAYHDTMPDCLGGGIGSPSPVWMRDYSKPSDVEPRGIGVQTLLDATLEAVGSGAGTSANGTGAHFDVCRMVVGHTPQDRVNAALRGKVWRVDVGASQGVMGGTPEVLEIVHGATPEEDVVSILTRDGKIPASERMAIEMIDL